LKILGIETSSHLFSLCISEDGTILYEVIRNRLADNSRDAHFFVEAEKLLDYYGLENIGAIAIDSGPGMFTSLRVGLTFAKGLAISKKIPVVAVRSLDVIGSSLIQEKTLLIGSGIVLMQETYGQEEHFIYSHDSFLLPSASKVIACALPRIKEKQFEDIEVLEPYYIKKTDAERNYNKTNAF
jgi:tRNA A37 threonylcarbamoyladenosine modification protein TsaB